MLWNISKILIHQMIEEIDMVCMEEFPSKKIFPFFYRDVIYIPSHDTSLLSLEQNNLENYQVHELIYV